MIRTSRERRKNPGTTRYCNGIESVEVTQCDEPKEIRNPEVAWMDPKEKGGLKSRPVNPRTGIPISRQTLWQRKQMALEKELATTKFRIDSGGVLTSCSIKEELLPPLKTPQGGVASILSMKSTTDGSVLNEISH